MIGGAKKSSKIVYQKYWMKVLLEDHEINGKDTFEYAIIDAPDWVITIPETDQGTLFLVKQYRPGWEQVSIEFPAGRLKTKNESFEEAAKRELREETGYIANKWEKLMEFRPIVWSKQKAKLFLASGLTLGETEFDEEEQIELIELTPDEIEGYIQDGRILQNSTIMSYYYWKDLKS